MLEPRSFSGAKALQMANIVHSDNPVRFLLALASLHVLPIRPFAGLFVPCDVPILRGLSGTRLASGGGRRADVRGSARTRCVKKIGT